MNKQFLLLLAFLSSFFYSQGGHEKKSSRYSFATYPATPMFTMQDDKYAAVNAFVSNNSNLPGFFDHTYKNKLVLGIDRTVTSLGSISSLLSQQIYTAKVQVKLLYQKLVLVGSTYNFQNVTTTQVLTVNYSGLNSHINTAPSTEVDIDTYNYEKGYSSMAIITSVKIYDKNNVLITTSNYPDNLYLEFQYDAERYHDLNTSSPNPFSSTNPAQIKYFHGTDSGDEIELQWNRIPGAEEYELEWLWLDEYTYDNTNPLGANPYWNLTGNNIINFRNNSTRIRTDQNTYRISNVYESGHLFFRIRAVGVCRTPASLLAVGIPPLIEYYSNWSFPDQTVVSGAPSGSSISSLGNGTPISLTVGGGVTGASYPYFIDLRGIPHENSKNWVYNSTYAEEGKKSEVVSYYDGSQHNRQSVTKNNTDNIALVGETYYDYLGRASVQALPTPVADATIKFYQQTVGSQTGFNFDNSSTPKTFNKDLFAQSTSAGQCYSAFTGFNNLYGTGKYYSANNPFQSANYNNGYTPDGETYPFSQTEYSEDNTGRIARQSGVGTALKIENSTAPKHDTRYLYGSVTQEELDRLFGSEVGYANHYTKNVVIDGNGQMSISYLNQEGKVIATALSGDKPGNVSALKSATNVDLSTTSNSFDVDLLNKVNANDVNSPNDNNILDGDKLVFNHNLVVTKQQNYLFDYRTLGGCFSACSSLCYDCMYDLVFDIKDKCGNRPANFYPVVYTLGKIVAPPGTNIGNFNTSMNIDGTGSNDNVNFYFQQISPTSSNSLTVLLDVGEYAITKTLKVNQSALDQYLANYLQNCATPLTTFQANEANIVDQSGCEMDCAECVASLGTLSAFITSYQTSNPGATTQEATDFYNSMVKECTEPCTYYSFCESAMETMMTDLSPDGQYAEYDLNGSTFNADNYPLSIFNSANNLPRPTSSSLEKWQVPLYYKTVPNMDRYYDENGNIDYVIVKEVSPGVYTPPLISAIPSASVPVLVDALNSLYSVQPQYLANASDFIAKFKKSWAKSLLTYHPEYCYLQSCIKNSDAQLTTPITVKINNYNSTSPYAQNGTSDAYVYTSDHFDSLLVSIDDIDDVNMPTGTPNTYLDIVFNPLLNDPYFTGTTTQKGVIYSAPTGGSLPYPIPAADVFPNPAMNNDATGSSSAMLTTATNRFNNYNNTGLNLWQYSALLSTPLVQQFGQSVSSLYNQLISSSAGYYTTAPTTGRDFILNLKKPGTTSDEYKRKAWETFVSLYLGLKNELQQEEARSYVMNGNCRGCNDCIGKPNFEYTSVKYTPYSADVNWQYVAGWTPNPTSIYNFVNSIITTLQDWYQPYNSTYSPNNKNQFCGVATSELYKNKIKRFVCNEDALDLDPSFPGNTQANLYAQTGLCPMAFDLQNFLNAVAVSSAGSNTLFATGINISLNIPQFTQELYTQNFAVTTPFTPAYLNFGTFASVNTTNDQYQANISCAGSSNCNLSLTFPASLPSGFPSAAANWNNYTGSLPTYTLAGLVGIIPGTGFGVFTIVGTIKSSSNTYTVQLDGTSCFNLTGCSFAPPCNTNGNGKAISSLMTVMASNYVFTSSTPPVLTNSPYNSVFVNTLKPILEVGPPSGSPIWKWDYFSSSLIKIRDYNSAYSNEIWITINSTYPSGINLNCIQSFQNFQPDPSVTGGFIVDGIINVPAGSPNSNGCAGQTVKITGTVFFGVPGFQSALPLGNCSFDLLTCPTKEHQVKRDLESFFSSSNYNNIITATSVNITSNQALTGLLRSYLNSAVNVSSSMGSFPTPPNITVPQNYYHWVKDLASTTYDIKGWFVVNTSATSPNSSSIPPGSCNVDFKFKTTTNSFASIISYDNVLVPYGYINGGNYYTYKIKVNFTSGSDSLLITTCWPVKDCKPCTGGSSSSGGPSIGTLYTIEDFTNLTNPTFNISSGNSVFNNNTASTTNVSLLQNEFAIASWPAQTYFNSGAISSCNTWGVGGSFPISTTINNLIFNTAQSCSSIKPVIFTKAFSVPASGIYKFNAGNFDVIALSNVKLDLYINNNLVLTKEYISGSLNSIYSSSPSYFSLIGNQINTFKLVVSQGTGGSNNSLGLVYMEPYDVQLVKLTYPTATPSSCDPAPQDTLPTAEYEEPCAPYLQDLVDNTADEKYNDYIDDLKAQFIANYKSHCLGTVIENLFMQYNNTDYHFTLYYYDEAGNLARTIPPQGVKEINLTSIYAGSQTNGAAIKEDRENYYTTSYSKKVYTQHQFQSTYTYNSLNQLAKQTTPDAGTSYFFYDKLGRLSASQNAEQYRLMIVGGGGIGPYSFTKYDELGRPVKVGKFYATDLTTHTSLWTEMADPNYPANILATGSSITEVTNTYYGDDANFSPIISGSNFSNGSQDNLRSRVASVTVEDLEDNNNSTYNHATHYSYDIHGNVKELIQDNPAMGEFTGQQFKRLQYVYDLISGKVNAVVYQRGARDMFVHSYIYDAGNRLTNVYTTRDSLLWDQDAKYYYYPHGPLARVETGEHKVQSSDYAYTLQGWIKGVNSEALLATNDIGKDGHGILNGTTNSYKINSFNARDAYGYALNYYNLSTTNSYADYVPVNGANLSASTYFMAGNPYISTSYAGNISLYNGNISMMSASYLNLDATLSQIPGTSQAIAKYDPYTFLKRYNYDQLNRIKTAYSGDLRHISSNSWQTTGGAGDYTEDFRYDLNGNILKATRQNVATTVDDLTYYYYDDAGGTFDPTAPPSSAFVPTNKLAYVDDAQGASTVGDIGAQSTGNYTYDANGNLISDALEEIATINWTLYGKIESIQRTTGSTKPYLYFKYDAAGNKISKNVSGTQSETTYYVRDAQGNVIATYDRTDIPGGTRGAPVVRTLTLKELNIFGSNRVGLLNSNDMLGYMLNSTNTSNSAIKTTPENKRTLGTKSYEMSNHLGNVLIVLSDRKIPVDNGTYDATGALTSSSLDNKIDYFVADLTSTTDYYAFGAPMKDRTYTIGSYRYGFNGKENDDEVKGDGNQQDYGMRVYDPRLGRFLSVDPIAADYPELTPYQFASNTPIVAIDIDGLEAGWTTLGTLSRISKVGFEVAELGMEVGVEVFEPVPLLPFPPMSLPVPNDKPILIPQRNARSSRDETNITPRVDPRLLDEMKGKSDPTKKQTADKVKKETENNSKRVSPKKLRQEWEESTGNKWPDEPLMPGKPQSVSHKKPLKDGGTNDPDNIEPMPWTEHIKMHKERGDYKRWAQDIWKARKAQQANGGNKQTGSGTKGSSAGSSKEGG